MRTLTLSNDNDDVICWHHDDVICWHHDDVICWHHQTCALKKLTYLNMHTCHLPPNFLHGLILRQPAMKKPSRGSKWTKDATRTTLSQEIRRGKSICGSSCFFLRESSCLWGHCRWVAFAVLHSCIEKWKMYFPLLSWKHSKTIAYVRNFSTWYVCTEYIHRKCTPGRCVPHVTPRQLQLSLVVRWWYAINFYLTYEY